MHKVIGVSKEGRKEIFWLYIADNEGSNYWLAVFNDLKARGVEDVLIAFVDDLKGFPDAIQTAFPECDIQLCIVQKMILYQV